MTLRLAVLLAIAVPAAAQPVPRTAATTERDLSQTSVASAPPRTTISA